MLNNITLVGRLTRDPELRQANDGTQIANFTLAVDDSFKNADGSKNTLFMDCSVFGKAAESVAKFTRKGYLAGVTGRLTSRKYTNKEGVNVTSYAVRCDHVEFMEPKGAAQGDTAPQQASAPIAGKNALDSIEVEEDSLPF